MTRHTAHGSPSPAKSQRRERREQVHGGRGRDLVVVLFVLALFLIPGRYALNGLGFFGNVAFLFATAAGMLWLCAFIFRRHAKAPHAQALRFVVLVYTASLLYSVHTAFSRNLRPEEAAGALRTLILLMSLIALSLVLVDDIRTLGALRRIVTTLVVCSYFSAVVGLAQRLVGLDVASIYALVPGIGAELSLVNDERAFGVRATGTATHPIEFAVVCASALPLSLHLWAQGEGWRRRGYALGSTVLAAACLVGVSRAGVLGLGIAVLLSVRSLRPRQVLTVAAAGVLLLVVLQFTARGVLSTLRYLFLNTDTDNSVSGRTDDYAEVNQLFEASPWTGLGLGTYNPSLYRILDNEYLGVVVTSGILGLSALLLLIITAWGTAGRAAKHKPTDAWISGLSVALRAGLAVIAASALFFDAFAFRQSVGTFFLLVGLIAACHRVAHAEPALSITSRLVRPKS